MLTSAGQFPVGPRSIYALGISAEQDGKYEKLTKAAT